MFFLFNHILKKEVSIYFRQLTTNVFLFSGLIFSCRYCKFIVAPNTETLLLHSKTCLQAPRPDKSYFYVCLFCKYHAYESECIRRHIRTHIGDKPFKCDFCDHRSARKSNILTHIKLKHSIQTSELKLDP